METITLSLNNLSIVLEKGFYFNEKEDMKDIKTNVNYKFETLGVNFSCELYVNNEGELGITTINGKEPETCEFFYSIKEFGNADISGLYYYLATNHGFLPSIEYVNNIYVHSEKSNYCDFAYDQESLYFLDMTPTSVKVLEGIEDKFYDIVKRVLIKDIILVELDFVNKKAYLSVFTNEESFCIKLGFFYQETIDQIINLRNQINLSILKNKAA